MKKVFANRDCIIMVLEKGETNRTDSAWLAAITRALGPDGATGILGRINVSRELWLYDTSTSKFHAWKNNGHINEAITRLEEMGVNVKVTAARITVGIASELSFCSDKDKFLFNLKFL